VTADPQRTLLDAIAAGDVETVRELVAADATLAGCRDSRGVSARMLARYHGQTEIVGILVDAGPELDVFEAAALGADERLEELLAHDRSLVAARSADGFTPLHLAAFFGHPQAALLLVEHGADVSDVAQNDMRVQPLHSAVAARQLGIAALLLDHGADPNARQQGDHVPLDAARQNGDEALVELLLARGAES
jgi:ankyrin repeat protein